MQDIDPSALHPWTDNVSKWPAISYDSIRKYLLESEASDGAQANAKRSMDAIQFYLEGWVDTVFIHELHPEVLVLKALVARSQAVNEHHNSWVASSAEGTIITAGCSCMAGKAKVCSHAAAILFKIQHAVQMQLTG